MITQPWLTDLFWLGVFVTVYAYAAFPLLMGLVARLGPQRRDTWQPAQPAVTVVIPAYNEAASIAAKIRNTLASAYPRPLLDVVVVSDASTDGTDEIARSFEPEGLRLIVQPSRQGKTAGLNRAVAVARGEILVLTDANAEYAPETLTKLLNYFSDPRVGLVSGYTRYRLQKGDVTEVTNLYTSLERLIKRGESTCGCCVGADGAIFAMRRSLYRTLRSDDINDFVLPLGVIDQGYECLFAEDAVCSENPGATMETEFRRQSRITNRTLRALWRNAHLMNPLRFPVFAFFLFSHKVIRFLAPIFLGVSALALVALGRSDNMYLALGAATVIVMVAALAWRTESKRSRVLSGVNAFLTINLAILNGWRKFLTGQADVTWQPDRTTADRTVQS